MIDLPFTREQFLENFAQYNRATWPLPVAASAVALLIVPVARRLPVVMLLLLSGLWAWMGLVYHAAYFSRINPAAAVFSTFFVIQAAIFALALLRRRHWKATTSFAGRIAGGVLILFAILVYPLLGHVIGHRLPAAPIFTLPCPTTIYTFGALLVAGVKLPLWAALIPLGWAAIGSSASVLLGMPQDVSLAASALVFLVYRGSMNLVKP